jgi:hypothetical protein
MIDHEHEQVPAMLEVTGGEVHAWLAEQPVTYGSFRDFLHATGYSPSEGRQPTTDPDLPVNFVSQNDAIAYCTWQSARSGRNCRLPSAAELEELLRDVLEEGVSPEVWSSEAGHRPEVKGGLKRVFLAEWTGDVEVIPATQGRSVRRLGRIFYPPWLRQGHEAAHAEAHLQSTEGYSFVTFRLASDDPAPARRPETG